MDKRKTFKLCRLCLCKGEVLIDIFQEDERLYIVADIIVDLLRLQVREGDDYPRFVCLRCFNKLSKFKQFKERCMESRDTFEKVFLPVLHSRNEYSEEDLDHLYDMKTEEMDEGDGTSVHDGEGSLEEVNGELHRQGAREDACVEANERTSHYVVKAEQDDPDERTESVWCKGEESLEEGNEEMSYHNVHTDRGFQMAERIPVQLSNEGVQDEIDSLNRKNNAAMTSAVTNSQLSSLGVYRIDRGSRSKGTIESVVSVDGEDRRLALLAKQNNSSFLCHKCIQGFDTKDEISEHLRVCILNGHGTNFFDGPSVSYSSLADDRTYRNDDMIKLDYNDRGDLHRTENSVHHRGMPTKTGGNVRKKMQSGLVQKYSCRMCDKQFISRKDLKVHVNEMHSNIKNPSSQPADCEYKCDVCSKLFKKRCNLERHMITHTGERPNQCNICSKAFTQRGNLERHILTHTGVRPHKCKVCSKTFIQKGSLKDHMLTHTGERPFACNMCSKSFTQRGNLQKHILTHTRERSHVCRICSKAFIHRSNLNTHMLIHDREKMDDHEDYL